MRTRSRALTSTSGFLLATLASSPAWSQTEGLEEVIVTATKREASIQDIPIAVTALSADFVDKVGLTGPDDLQKYVPNLVFRDDISAGQKGFVIRGVGTGTNGIGVEGSVGVVVDNVVLGREGAGVSGFADIERIEVLRGPQGTLFGKNSSAGVINITTKRPNFDEFEGRVKASYGNYDDYRVTGHFTGPLADTFAMHLSAFTHGFDGYSHNVLTNSDVNGGDESGARLKLLYEPSDDLSFQLLGDYLEADHECCEWSLRTVQPGTLHDVLVTGPGLAEAGSGSRDTVQEEHAADKVEQGGVSGEINWSIGDYTLTSITAYRTWKNRVNIVPDLIPARIMIIDSGQDFRDQSQFTQEFRLASPEGDRFTYVLGLFYFEQDLSIDSARGGFGFYGVVPGVGVVPFVPDNSSLVSQIRATDDTTNMAAFGDGSIRLSDNLSLLVGLRYTTEEISATYDRVVADGAVATHPGFPPLSFTIDDLDDDEVTYRAGLQYNWSAEVMGYAIYSTGYKGAGIDLDPNLAVPSQVVPPETVDNIELGVKSMLMDGRLQLNVAAFTADFENYQGTAFDPDSVAFNLQSVKGLRTDGVELELVALPVADLRLFANAAWIDAKWTDFTNGACFPGQTEAQGCVNGVQNLNDEQLPRSPEFAYTIGADYTFDISAQLLGFVNGNYAWRDGLQFGIDNDPNTETGSVGLLDLSVGVRTNDDRYEVTLWGKNVLDEDYDSIMFGQLGGAGNYSGLLGAPATYGASVSVNF